MDKKRAQFILRCYRPEGEDATIPEFQEALQMALKDRELGEWLTQERASDASFAEALAATPLPCELRNEVLSSLQMLHREKLQECNTEDLIWQKAIMQISPPPELRNEILAAMTASSNKQKIAKPRRFRSVIGIGLAAAAGIMLALFLTDLNERKSKLPTLQVRQMNSQQRPSAMVPISYLEDRAVSHLESPDFYLDLVESNPEALYSHLRKSNVLCPDGCLPQGLRKVAGQGCSVIEIDGRRGALISFQQNDGKAAYLIIFRAEDVACKLSDSTAPLVESRGNWSVAKWQENKRVFLLLSNSSPSELRGMF